MILDGLKTTAIYGKGEVVFHESDPCHAVFALCSGSVKLVTSSSEGRVLLLRFAGPGDLLGVAEAVLGQRAATLRSYECTAVAAEPSILAAIPSEKFVRFASSYPEAAFRLARALSEQYRIAQRETKFLAFGETSTVRLARLLLEWSAERGVAAVDGVHVRSRLTHTEIAQSIGATRETVTRILSELSGRGILVRGQGEIVIRSSDELTHVASAD